MRRKPVLLNELNENYEIINNCLYLPLKRNSLEDVPLVNGYKTYINLICPICKNYRFILFLGPKKTKNKMCHSCSQLTKTDKEKEIINNKKIETSLKRYGVKNIMFLESTKDKIRRTTKENHGCYSYFSSDEFQKKMDLIRENWSSEKKNSIKNKRKETCIKKYGVENPQQNEEIKNKTKKTLIEKYGVNCSLLLPQAKEYLGEYKNISQTPTWKNNHFLKALSNQDLLKKGLIKHFENNTPTVECVNCHSIFDLTHTENGRIDYNCYKCNPLGNYLCSSELERLMLSFLLYLNIDFKLHDRKIIKPLELDFLIGNKALEIDGIYYHSLRDKYHIKNKSDICEKAKIKCLHIFDKDIYENFNLVKFLIKKEFLGLQNQNNTIISYKILNNKDYKDFIKSNSINPNNYKADLKIGFIDKNNNIIRVVGICDNMIIQNCPSIIYDYNDSFIDAFKIFKNNFYIKKLYTNLDKRLFSGKTYLDLGFKPIENISPQKIFAKNSKSFCYDCGHTRMIYEN